MTKRILYVATLIAVVGAGAVRADDRDLLRSQPAPPNVLLILDSGGTMNLDVTNTQMLPASGDSPAAKLYQAKDVLSWFVTQFPDFNMGFTFFEKEDLRVLYLNYVYRVKAVDSTGAVQPAMLDGTQPGTGILRMGDTFSPYNDALPQVPPLPPIRFGKRGEYCTDLLYAADGSVLAQYPKVSCDAQHIDGGLPEPTAVGDVAIRSFIIANNSENGKPKETGPPYYYPAYRWDNLDPLVAAGLTGAMTWQAVATAEGLDTSTEAWKRTLHDMLLDGDERLRSDYATQIGSPMLKVEERKYVAVQVRVGNKWVLEWSEPTTQRTETEFVTQFVLYEGPISQLKDGGNITSRAHDQTLTCQAWQGNGGDCRGYYDYNPDKMPLVDIPWPDPSTGATSPNRDYLASFFKPAPTGFFYFPTRDGNFSENEPGYYLPATRDYKIPYTDAMMAGGRRSIHDSLSEADHFFVHNLRLRPDPLRDCRKDFIILVTDGTETCNTVANAACNQARNLGRDDIPVFVVGFGSEPDFNSNAFHCIADNSGGDDFIATDKEQLKEALLNIGRVIKERLAAFAAPAVPSVELATREKGYISTFFTINGRSLWEGHLRGYLVDPATGVVPRSCQTDIDGNTLCYPDTSKALWDAGAVLAEAYANWNQRRIFFGTNNATAGAVPGTRQEFKRLSATELALWNRIIEPDPPVTSDTFTAADRGRLDQIVGFIRGDRASIDDNADGVADYRFPYDTDLPQTGISILGDIFHSVPVINGRPDCYACYQTNMNGYIDYYNDNTWRRKVLLVGADDGALHAFDAGFYARNPDRPDEYDDGTGNELWAWVPNAVMSTLDNLAEGTDHYYSVDGSPVVTDAFIDPSHGGTPAAADREWRTLAMFGLRAGGSSVVALDITRPDPYDADGVPQSAAGGVPACVNGGTGCSGEYPRLLWEFTDTHTDLNGRPDLAQTWSTPSVGLVKVRGAADGSTEETRFVAIFGGGYDPSLQGGDFLYMVDIETGKTLLKIQAGASVPGEVGLLDVNFDGYLERIYWNDLAGNIWRMNLTSGGNPAVAQLGADGAVSCSFSDADTAACSSWGVKKLFTPGVAAGYQPLFQRPLILLAGYDANQAPIYAIGAGSGDRENILAINDPNDAINPNPYHRFYLVMDPGTDAGLPYDESDLQPIGRDSAVVAADTNYLDPASSTIHGWYLILGTDEKVNTPGVALNDLVVFSTFTPSRDVITETDATTNEVACYRRGDAKTYRVSYLNANPPAGETSRYIQFSDDVLMVSETIKYVGEDGKVHGLQTTDNLAIAEPVEAQAVGGALVSWRER